MNYILIAIYFVMATIWIVMLIKGTKKYSGMIEPLETKNFLFKALYPVGFEFLELINYKYTTRLDFERLTQCKIIYGDKYGEYYFRVNKAEKFTYLLTFIMLSPILGAMFGNPIFIAFGIGAGAVLYYNADTKITDVIKKRTDAITSEFSSMVSKMALLINAGMITREAWDSIANSSEGTLYEEMRNTSVDMQNGMSEVDAYIRFSERCYVPMVKKFISMLVQNLSKGNRELVEFLRDEASNIWEEKKHYVKRKGEEAGNKLMIPLGMILIGVFIMILVPIASKIGF